MNRKSLKNHPGNEKKCLSFKNMFKQKYDTKSCHIISSVTMDLLISLKITLENLLQLVAPLRT